MSGFLDGLPGLAVLIMGGALGWLASEMRWWVRDAAVRGRQRVSDAGSAFAAFLVRCVLVVLTIAIALGVLAVVYVNLPHD